MKTGNRAKSAETSHFAPNSAELAVTGRKKKKSWLPFIGIVLVLAGLVFFAATSGMAAAQWLLGLWPLFAIIAGVASVMGFAVERKPKSPVGGMLLIFVGVLFSAARFHSNLNALQIYGRYWLLLLFVYAGIELVRHYSHRLNDGKPPRLFSFGKLFMVMLIAGSGVLANRVAVNNPSFLAQTRLPGIFGTVRDAVIGKTYNFSQEVALPLAGPDGKLIINNSHGNVRIVGGLSYPRALLQKKVRAWKQEDASAISDKIQLLVKKEGDGSITVSTNREDVKAEVRNEFNTDIEIEVPSSYGVSITNSNGDISAREIQGDLSIRSSFGRVEVNNLSGDAVFTLKNSEAAATNIHGDVKMTGAKRVHLTNVDGQVDIEANNGSIEMRGIKGAVNVEASYTRITATDLKEHASLKSSYATVTISDAASVEVDAPFSGITATNIRGDVEIKSSHKDIRATEIAGNLTVEGERSEVRAEGIQGNVKITTSHGDVTLKNFRQGVEVETSYRDVVLTVGETVNGNITVQNERGEIKFVYPQASLFRLDAQSEGGRVKTRGIDDFEQEDSESLSRGSSGPIVKLRTSFREILVQASGTRQAQNKGPVTPPTALNKD
jgi:uncharacterized membrane protein HdeD (DUF308 family)